MAKVRGRLLPIIFLQGFCSGIPLALTGSTLQAWMTDAKVDLKVIGLFALVGLPYSFKFVWAPLLDRYVPPFLGRRRGWILLTQALLAVTIAMLATVSPSQLPAFTAAVAVCVAFFSASQDTVIDAYRTDILTADEFGPGASVHVLGYRIAMLVSGAVALMLADHLPWRVVYLIMASTMAIGVASTFAAPEPENVKPPRSLKDAVVLPFMEYFTRKGWAETLGFAVLYKMDVVIAMALLTPFLLGLGFTKTDIGAVNKGFGLISSIIGTLAGGALMVRLGMKRSLWTFGLTQGISGLAFIGLAVLGHNYPMMVFAIAAENFFSGMGNAAYTGFIMSLCDRRFTATQYALLSSLMAMTRTLGGAPAGYLAKSLGWEKYYIFSLLASIPSLLLLTRFDRWTRPSAVVPSQG